MYMQLNWGKSYVYVLVVNAIRVSCSGHVVRVDKASGIRCDKWHISLPLIARSWEYKVHSSSKLVAVKNYWSNLVAKTCFQTLDLKLDCKCCFQTFFIIDIVMLSFSAVTWWSDFANFILNLGSQSLLSNSALKLYSQIWLDCQTFKFQIKFIAKLHGLHLLLMARNTCKWKLSQQ